MRVLFAAFSVPYGKNEMEEALIDMICEHVEDIKMKFADCKRGLSGEELTVAKAKFFAETLPMWMNKLEKCVEKNYHCDFDRGNDVSFLYLFPKKE